MHMCTLYSISLSVSHFSSSLYSLWCCFGSFYMCANDCFLLFVGFIVLSKYLYSLFCCSSKYEYKKKTNECVYDMAECWNVEEKSNSIIPRIQINWILFVCVCVCVLYSNCDSYIYLEKIASVKPF